MLAIWTSYQHYILAATGVTLVGGALLWLLFSEYRRYNPLPATAQGATPEANRTRWLVALSLIVLVGAVLRIYDIDLKTITHPEVYSPNIDLPADISTPPPRHGFVETLRWHFLAEPHPVGYYMGMWAWTCRVGRSCWGRMRTVSPARTQKFGTGEFTGGLLSVL